MTRCDPALQEKLTRLMEQEFKQSECLWHDTRWKIMTLPGSQSGVLFGYLMVSAEGLEPEDRAILRLFAKQLAVGIEGRLFTDELARVARTDNLTGLPNRQAFEEEFHHYQAVLARHPERHLALFMLDLNGLKRTNDQYGHEAGDALLIQMARQLRTLCRQDEKIFRIGGDEFVLLAEADHLASQQLAGRLEASQQHAIVQHGGSQLPAAFCHRLEQQRPDPAGRAEPGSGRCHVCRQGALLSGAAVNPEAICVGEPFANLLISSQKWRTALDAARTMTKIGALDVSIWKGVGNGVSTWPAGSPRHRLSD